MGKLTYSYTYCECNEKTKKIQNTTKLKEKHLFVLLS